MGLKALRGRFLGRFIVGVMVLAATTFLALFLRTRDARNMFNSKVRDKSAPALFSVRTILYSSYGVMLLFRAHTGIVGCKRFTTLGALEDVPFQVRSTSETGVVVVCIDEQNVPTAPFSNLGPQLYLHFFDADGHWWYSREYTSKPSRQFDALWLATYNSKATSRVDLNQLGGVFESK